MTLGLNGGIMISDTIEMSAVFAQDKCSHLHCSFYVSLLSKSNDISTYSCAHRKYAFLCFLLDCWKTVQISCTYGLHVNAKLRDIQKISKKNLLTKYSHTKVSWCIHFEKETTINRRPYNLYTITDHLDKVFYSNSFNWNLLITF